MNSIEMEPWGKTARLNRRVVVTEKIDGTNAAVMIQRFDSLDHITRFDATGDVVVEKLLFDGDAAKVTAYVGDYVVVAQSRTRIIVPGTDNHGFAGWVQKNAETLVEDLGEGRHFGEWWGSGIQRGYGLTKGDKRFSLFNTERFKDAYFKTPGVRTVPVLQEMTGLADVNYVVAQLARSGSQAAPGFMKPEGVVAFHTASRTGFKVTIEKDEAPKGQAQ